MKTLLKYASVALLAFGMSVPLISFAASFGTQNFFYAPGNVITALPGFTTSWSSSGQSGNVATSTTETANQIPYWTSTNGGAGHNKATLGSSAGFTFDGTGIFGFGGGGGLWAVGASSTQSNALLINSTTTSTQTALTGLSVSTSGNVGIGTSTSVYPLQIQNTQAGTSPDNIVFTNGSSAASTGGCIAYNLTTTGSILSRFCAARIAGGRTDFTWSAIPNGGFSIQTNMTLLGTGALGIGTTTPFYALTVSSSTAAQLALTDGTATSNQWVFRNAGGLFYMATSTTFATSSSAAFSMDANGIPSFPSLGSGVVSAASGVLSAGTLAISSGGTNNSSAYTAGSVIFSNGTSLTQNNANFFWDNTALSLGIGTTTPRWAITAASSTGPQLALTDASAASNAYTMRTVGNTFYFATSTYSATSTQPVFTVNPNSVTTFSNTVSIGSTAVSASLIGGGLNVSGQAAFANNNFITAASAGLWFDTVGNFDTGIKRDSGTNLQFVPKNHLGGGAQSDTYMATAGNWGFGTSTPFGRVAISLNPVDAQPGTNALFIASSTATATTTLFAITNTGHMIASSTNPVLSSCGTSPTLTGSDGWGEVVPGATATGCTITFGQAWSNAPICTVSNQSMSVVNAMTYTISSTILTISMTGIAGDKVDYICHGVKGAS